MEKSEIPKKEPQEQNKEVLTRRDFLKLALGVGGGLIASQYLERKLPSLFKDKPVSLTFYSEYHFDSEEKMKIYEKMLNEADALAIEFGPWDDEGLDWHRKNSEGVEGFAHKDNFRGLLHGSQKPIYPLDPQENHPVWEEFAYFGKVFAMDKTTYTIPYQQRIEQLKFALIDSARAHLEREKVWKKQLEQAINELRQMNKFKNKEKINLLIQIGATHSDIFYKFKEEASHDELIKVTRFFSEMPFVWDTESEIVRRIIFKNELPTEEKITNYLLERMIEISMGGVYGDHLDAVFDESLAQFNVFVREVISQFSVTEVQAIYEQIRQDYLKKSGNLSDSNDQEKMKEIINQALQQKNIIIPKTRVELNEHYPHLMEKFTQTSPTPTSRYTENF